MLVSSNFGEAVVGFYSNQQEFILLLNAQGGALLQQEEISKPPLLINDAYLFQTFDELHNNFRNTHEIESLQPATTPAMVDFLIQSHILPLKRDLEVVEFGIKSALKKHKEINKQAEKAVSLFLKHQFGILEKAEKLIRSESRRIKPKMPHSNSNGLPIGY